jgi:hypothetical protein
MIRFCGKTNLSLTCLTRNMHQIKKNFKYMQKNVQNQSSIYIEKLIFSKIIKGSPLWFENCREWLQEITNFETIFSLYQRQK